MMLGLEIVTIALVLVVGCALLIGNSRMEKLVHQDNKEAEEYLAAAKKNQRTSA
ncbi:hypothetical protein [Alicyclobacillus acidiphilus]|uniref:hypothetical protein n=1 Tax=Alicyclobacillus acidiphilus TaxID=182455 RepID=UPI000B03C088|nr:hypothetical protein [Alicyclobacillus acidiphilus]